MKLSIITVNLNNKVGLQKTIDSVISQTFKDFEWIVIDGGSTDGSKELIEKYSNYISYWVSEPDKGIYNGMNKGIKHSNGEYLLFLNSGDILHTNSIIDFILSDQLTEDIIIFDILLQGKGKKIKKDLSLLSSLSVVSFLLYSTFPHQSTLIKKKLFKECGMYNLDYRIVADWVLFFEACVFKDASYIYKKGTILSEYDLSGLSSTNKDAAYNERINYLKTHYSSRMISYLTANYKKEKQQISLNRPIFKVLYKCLLWLSDKYNLSRYNNT